MSRKNTACFITRKDALLYLCCFLQNLVENLGSWLLVVILLSLLPSHFQLNLYLKKPCQILKSGIVLSVHLCCSSAAGEADFPPGVETQGWFMLKRTSSCNAGHRRIFFLFCQHIRTAVVCWVWGQVLNYIGWVLVFFDLS